MMQGGCLQLLLHLLSGDATLTGLPKSSFLVTQRSLRQRWAGGHNRFAVEEGSGGWAKSLTD
jgi:hypothetical protein